MFLFSFVVKGFAFRFSRIVGLNCETFVFGAEPNFHSDKLHISFHVAFFFEEGLERRQKKAIFFSFIVMLILR